MCRFRYRENTVKKVPMIERDDTYQAIRGACMCSPPVRCAWDLPDVPGCRTQRLR
jgi:hypothetical protein